MKKYLVLLSALAFCSCSSSKYELSSVVIAPDALTSNKNYEIGTEKVRGDSLGSTLLFVPMGNPTIEDAVRRAAKNCEGNCIGLSDVIVEHSVDSSLLLLFGSNSVSVTGYPIIQK